MLKDKYNCGIDFILSSASPYSQYGNIELSNISQFRNTVQLENEFADIESIVKLINQYKNELTQIGELLSTIPYISKIVDKLSLSILDEIEFFHIKCFLLDFIRLTSITNGMGKPQVGGLNFVDVSEVLRIFDPKRKNIRSFAYIDVATEKYKQIINRKKQIEELINNSLDNNLMKLRNSIVIEELTEESQISALLCHELCKFTGQLLTAVSTVARLDLLIYKARLAVKFDCVKPTISSNELSLINMVNPLVQASLQSKNVKYQPISLTLNKGTTIITGVNMGGKSVVLKSVIMNVQLFLYGFFCCAEYACLPLFDEFSFIGQDSQSMQDGISTFAAQMIQLNSIINSMNNKFIFIAFDEPSSGTNPREGALIANSVAKFFNDKNVILLMSTHYDLIDLKEFVHYRVAGLTMPDNASITPCDVAKYMDYSLVKTDAINIPQHAVKICRMLNMNDDFLKLLK